MKVKELIEKLKEFDQELDVCGVMENNEGRDIKVDIGLFQVMKCYGNWYPFYDKEDLEDYEENIDDSLISKILVIW